MTTSETRNRWRPPLWLLLSGWVLADEFSDRHVFPEGTVVPDGCGIVVFGGPTPTGAFGGMEAQVASTGLLGFNNGGDTAILRTPGGEVVDSLGYDGAVISDQSVTRDPDGDITAPGVAHSTASGSSGALFSAGTQVDGTPFPGCPDPRRAILINEVLGDPPAAPDGDANGDGVRSALADEFVEIVNNSGADVDMSGWVLADEFSDRHVFPAGTIVPDGCGIIVEIVELIQFVAGLGIALLFDNLWWVQVGCEGFCLLQKR